MDQAVQRKIAERFAQLTPEQRRAVYQKITAEGMGIAQFPVLPRHAAQARSPASYAQMRQWFLWQLDPTSTAYHIAGALRLKGALDIAAVRSSFAALVDRHEALRTVFAASAEGHAEQIILPAQALDIPLTDLSSAADISAQTQAAAQTLSATPFDLTRGPLLRVGLIREAADAHVLVLVLHHIIADGWSMQVLVDEFVALYQASVAGQPLSLAPLPIQYADYALWQRHWLEAGEKERQLAWWQQRLGPAQSVLQLAADHPRRADAHYTAANAGLTLSAALAQALQRRALASGSTLFMVLLAGFQVWLQRQTGQTELRVGVPIANRHRVETEGVIGFFVNTQILPTQISAETRLADVIAQSKDAAVGAQAHQDLPFEQLVEALQPERNSGASPLFQVLFNHLRGDLRALEQLPGLTLEPYALGAQAAQYELTLNTHERPDGSVDVGFSYAAELFDAVSVERWLAQYQAVLHALAQQPDLRVADIDMLPGAGYAQWQDWATQAPAVPAVEPVAQLLERQAQQRPGAPAVISAAQTLSYAGLNRQANQLAHYLISQGVGAEARVGVALPRSALQIVAILAILKAGAAYVPLDPDYPVQRRAYMVADSGISLLLVVTAQPDFAVPVIALDTLDLRAMPDTNLSRDVRPEQLAYVMYTSGSTGQPKGVAVTQRGIHRLVSNAGYARLDAQVRMLQFAPLAFDASTFEIWGCLAHGGALIQAPPGPLDFAALASLIEQQDINTAWLTAALFNQMLETQPQALAQLQQLLTGGEAMSAHHARMALDQLGGTTLINGYGPTECTTFAACQTMTPAHLRASSIPLGQPVTGTQCYVLDARLQPTPPGAVGELYLGGAGLARGYLGQPALTAQRFIANPFADDGSRLYRTGDQVRWNNAGELEYLGRADQQVKIRGFRIEPGEIEAQLLAVPGVRQAVVLVRGGRLLAWVAADIADTGGLRQHLADKLPDYMVPARVHVLGQLPVNANGKIDRAALPDDDAGAQGYQPPQGAAEIAMAALWAQVLSVERVGRDDNFFELGGHSLLALRLVTLAKNSASPFTLQDLMRWPSIASLLSRRNPASPLTLLNQPQADRAPLFCLHPGFGTVIDYRNLAQHLNGQRSVYGVACRTLFDPQHRDSTLAQMASDYIAQIRQVQTHGPYHLLGWSLGGALATLITAQLEAAGQQVAFLGLLDTSVPTEHFAAAARGWQWELSQLLGALQSAERATPEWPESWADPLAAPDDLLRWLQQALADGQLVLSERYQGLSAEEIQRFFLSCLNLAEARARSVFELPVIRTQAHCWWSAEQPQAAIDAFLAQVQTPAVQLRTGADHEAIVRDEAVMAGVVAVLAAV